MCEYFSRHRGSSGYSVYHDREGMVSWQPRVCSGVSVWHLLITWYWQGSEERLAANGCAIIPRPCPQQPTSSQPCFLKVPQPPQTAPPTGPTVPICESMEDIPHPHPNIGISIEEKMHIALHFHSYYPLCACLPLHLDSPCPPDLVLFCFYHRHTHTHK